MTKEKRPPGDTGHLHRLIQDYAAKQQMPPQRLQRWLNAMIVTAVLDRVRDEDGEPIFLLKGGFAMELRLQLRARATKDYDAAFRAKADEILDLLDEAIREPWGHFDVTRSESQPISNTKALQIRLKLTYKSRDWGSVYVEMAPVEGDMGSELDRVPATPLDPLQLEGPDDAPCVSVRYQVAQKLHACTEVFTTGRENDRFRDVMDILLLEDLLRDVGLGRAREACVDIFTVRDKHAWPPKVTVYESWREPFAVLAAENNFEPAELDAALVRSGLSSPKSTPPPSRATRCRRRSLVQLGAPRTRPAGRSRGNAGGSAQPLKGLGRVRTRSLFGEPCGLHGRPGRERESVQAVDEARAAEPCQGVPGLLRVAELAGDLFERPEPL